MLLAKCRDSLRHRVIAQAPSLSILPVSTPPDYLTAITTLTSQGGSLLTNPNYGLRLFSVTLMMSVPWNFAPQTDWRGMGGSEHFVQFYEAEGFLLNSLSGFIGTAINAGDGALVVATGAHRESLDALFLANGLDLVSAKARGQYVSLDAAETLSKFMVDGSPEPRRFTNVIGTVIESVTDGRNCVRAFGEMVALLWAEGNYAAAIRLEELME